MHSIDELEAFVSYFLPHHILDAGLEFPRELLELTSYRRVAIAAPRFFGKSYSFSFFYPLFKLLEDPGVKIALVSATASLADEFLARIRRELESNRKLIDVYGLQESGTWRSDKLVLLNGSEVRSFGAEKQLRGFHPQLVICDDLETGEMVVSKDRREKFDRWFLTDLEGTLGHDSQIIVVGTLLEQHSFLADLVNKGWIGGREVEGWETRFYKAIKDDGESLFPEKWPIDELHQKRREIGEYAFEQEYQNNPVPDEAKRFKEDWIEYYDREPPGCVYYTAVDPAISLGKGADFTAIVTAAVDADFNIYVVDVVHERLLPKEVVNAMFEVYNRFEPVRMGIETVGFQKMLKYDFELQRRQRKVWPVLEELKPDGKRKEVRIQSLQPRFQDGTIFLKHNQKNLVNELLMFPSPRSHDDIIDALSYLLTMVRPAAALPEKVPENTFIEYWKKKKTKSRVIRAARGGYY